MHRILNLLIIIIKKVLFFCYYIGTVNALLSVIKHDIINLKHLVYSIKQNEKLCERTARENLTRFQRHKAIQF